MFASLPFHTHTRACVSELNAMCDDVPVTKKMSPDIRLGENSYIKYPSLKAKKKSAEIMPAVKFAAKMKIHRMRSPTTFELWLSKSVNMRSQKVCLCAKI